MRVCENVPAEVFAADVQRGWGREVVEEARIRYPCSSTMINIMLMSVGVWVQEADH